jgi:ketosteroid isomerase-like protein
MIVRFIALTCLAAAAGLSSAPAAAASACGGPQSVVDAYAQWTQAYARHDLAGTMSFFDRSVTMAFAGAPDATYVQLEASYKKEFATTSDTRWVPAFETPEASGDLAVLVSRWRLVKNGQDLVRNRGVDILRCEDGRWKITRSLNYVEWQRPRPTPAP